jgi:hypothetical protein
MQGVDPMKDSPAQPVLKRLDTGSRCDVRGCYEMAMWVISFGGKNYHWCAKHTRKNMRHSERWRRDPAYLDFVKPSPRSPKIL